MHPRDTRRMRVVGYLELVDSVPTRTAKLLITTPTTALNELLKF